jgi:hypothetical protein
MTTSFSALQEAEPRRGGTPARQGLPPVEAPPGPCKSSPGRRSSFGSGYRVRTAGACRLRSRVAENLLRWFQRPRHDEVGDVDLDGLSRAELERLHKGLTTLCLMEESQFNRVIDACLAGKLSAS